MKKKFKDGIGPYIIIGVLFGIFYPLVYHDASGWNFSFTSLILMLIVDLIWEQVIKDMKWDLNWKYYSIILSTKAQDYFIKIKTWLKT